MTKVTLSEELRNSMQEKKLYTYNYPMPAMTADIILFSPDKSHIVCIKRRDDPFKGSWALPGGFMNIDERLAVSAARELYEETGITVDVDKLEFVGLFDNPNRDKRGRVISSCFTAQLKIPTMVKAGDDAADAGWVMVDRLVSKELPLAFDHYDMLTQVLTGMNYFEH